MQHEALSSGRAGSEMFPTSASSCSESSWGFPLTEVIVSRVTGFALGDKKHVCSRVQGQMEQRQAVGRRLLSALSSFIENYPEITEIYSSGG